MRKGPSIKRLSRRARKRAELVHPNPRGRGPFKRYRRRQPVKWLLGLVVVAGLVAPPSLDAASLLWRQNKGCKVWQVIDGDTVRLYCASEGFVSGRIKGYDTPELKARCPQEFLKAVAATYYLRWQLWGAGEVVATPRERDRYDRVLTLLSVDGTPAGSRLVEAGLARWYDGGKRRSWCGV